MCALGYLNDPALLIDISLVQSLNILVFAFASLLMKAMLLKSYFVWLFKSRGG